MARYRLWAAPVTFVALVAMVAVGANLVDETTGAVPRAVAGAAVAVLLWGARLHRATPRGAWVLVAAGALVWVTDGVWDALVVGTAEPGSAWYAVADTLYLVMFPALFATVLLLAGRLVSFSVLLRRGGRGCPQDVPLSPT